MYHFVLVRSCQVSDVKKLDRHTGNCKRGKLVDQNGCLFWLLHNHAELSNTERLNASAQMPANTVRQSDLTAGNRRGVNNVE